MKLMLLVILWWGFIVSLQWDAMGQPFIRKVANFPEGLFWNAIDVYKDRIFVIFPYGLVDLRTLSPEQQARMKVPEWWMASEINPEVERLKHFFRTQRVRAVAIAAALEAGEDFWLASTYDYWVVDISRNLAYALKPVEERKWDYNRWQTVEKIRLRGRKVEGVLQVPAITHIALSLDGEKLYVASNAPGDSESSLPDQLRHLPGIVVVDTATMKVRKILHIYGSHHAPEHMVLSKDGKNLFCGFGWGLVAVEVSTDKFIPWEDGREVLFLKRVVANRLAIAEDGKELYTGINGVIGEGWGGVIAVDLEKRRVVRELKLSKFECTSISVVSNKLFAACLDGVYVIDIPEWRKQNDK